MGSINSNKDMLNSIISRLFKLEPNTHCIFVLLYIWLIKRDAYVSYFSVSHFYSLTGPACAPTNNYLNVKRNCSTAPHMLWSISSLWTWGKRKIKQTITIEGMVQEATMITMQMTLNSCPLWIHLGHGFGSTQLMLRLKYFKPKLSEVIIFRLGESEVDP